MKFSIYIVLATFILIGSSPSLYADSHAALISMSGEVEGRLENSWKKVERGQEFAASDAVKTGKQSTAGVRFQDGFLVRLNQKTTVEFSNVSKGSPLSLGEGTAYFFSRKPRRFPQVKTPQVSASVRGTEFVVTVKDGVTEISVLEGAVEASNQFGSLVVAQGEKAVTRQGTAPVKEVLLNPLDAVQWVLYFPAVLSVNDFPIFASTAKSSGLQSLREGNFPQAIQDFNQGTWQDHMGRAIAMYRSGDTANAMKVLNDASSHLESQLLKASIYMALGDLDGARAIHYAMEASGDSSSELEAQKALIALSSNQKDEAKGLIAKALAQSPDSFTSLLVSSYVHQSFFDLKSAEDDIERILSLDPRNALARTRLADLKLSTGDLESATNLANESLKENPNDVHARTVLGFSLLSRQAAKDAKAAFEDVLGIDDDYALAHLGLGLALIKAGDLEQGREEIEVASYLAPQISLYRSYLGKAYFEEEKEDLSEREYNRAIELDKRDPTPYLYRSFLRLSQHRPIEALSDIESSIERNDNRAVFRSKLQLDKDDAVRGASLGKIYSRIGFSELARIEATKALNHDYANYSAHFLLADLFKDTHLNQRAQTTENLIGRLLVPVNYNSNDTDLLGGESSLNEYTSLFSRPVSRTRVGAGVNSALEQGSSSIDHTYADNTFGMKVGYSLTDRAGFRQNDYQREKQLFVQGQYQLLERDTLVWDATFRKNDQGDVVIDTDPYAEDEDLSTSLDSGLVRVGAHHEFSSDSHLIGQAFYNYGDFEKQNRMNTGRFSTFDITDSGELITVVPFSFDGVTDESINTTQNLFRGDLQYILDQQYYSVILGGSIRREQFDNEEQGFISDPGTRTPLSFLNGYPYMSAADVHERSERAFLYTKLRPLDWLNFDLGLTYSHLNLGENTDLTPFTSDTFSQDSFDPKLGTMVQLHDNLSLRASYAETLGRTDQGGIGPLEPTFVGGFNQVFDGIRGSDQEFWAVGLDGKLPSKKTFLGTSFQHRDISLNRPFSTSGLSIENGELTTSVISERGMFSNDATEERVSGYLYQVLTNQISATLKYDWEDFEQGADLPAFITNRAAMNLRYFDPSGFFSFGKGTWRNQNSEAISTSTGDSFWVFDIGAGYEFDSFHGFASLELQNIFDQDFNYAAIRDEALLLPEFSAIAQFSYNF